MDRRRGSSGSCVIAVSQATTSAIDVLNASPCRPTHGRASMVRPRRSPPLEPIMSNPNQQPQQPDQREPQHQGDERQPQRQAPGQGSEEEE
ncbi:hypothetical protein E2F49_08800 [Luteimonas terrae]|uniref:Uncharacterized protein n=1 Tax=Luteimonas terrae TaxID=1530191 RepID=A0A4R5UA12_9GAMM|nr:hypothetical protein E2F49_08800 [Luteimonas terrae]